MHRFIVRNLDPASRLGEILFGLIMALGFTASARLGLEEADNRELFVSILGCNVAWAIVDAVMYVLTEIFERGRKRRLAREIRATDSDASAIEKIAGELDEVLAPVTSAEQRDALYAQILPVIRGSDVAAARLTRDDLLGGVAVALIIVLATFPVVLPFLFDFDAGVAVRLSNGVAVLMLFLLGARWGSMVGASPWRIGSGLMCLGLALVAVTIALGG